MRHNGGSNVAITTLPRSPLAPEMEIRFIWAQVATLLSSYRSHRTLHVNDRLAAMYQRINDLERLRAVTPESFPS
jgi:hypothetical protein